MKIVNIEEMSEIRQALNIDEDYDVGSYLAQINSAGMELLKTTKIPSAKEEEWRFTKIKPLFEQDYRLAGDFFDVGDINLSDELSAIDSYKIVFVNGNYREDLSDLDNLPEEKIIVGSFSDVEAEKNMEESERKSLQSSFFTSLNAALCYDGVFIYVMEDQQVDKPLHIIHYTVNNTGNSLLDLPRNLIILGENSRLDVIESYFAEGDNFSFINAANHFTVKKGAKLNYYKIQRGCADSNHLHNQYITQEEGSQAAAYAVDFGGGLTRNSLNVEMNGKKVTTLANGIYFARGNEAVDNHVLIDHLKEDGISSELYRGILAESARGVFRGKIMVRPNAQRTDADQNNNCLLLSDDARINTMPQLEIYADDVKCTHGATVGELDNESIFYLRSRGIGEETAKGILIKAFIAEVVEKIENSDVKNYIERLVDDYLNEVVELGGGD